MSAYESSYKSLLQGVSQQIPRERLPGQVSAQDNMLSDLVTNLRRRPGAEYRYNLEVQGSTAQNVLAWNTDIAGTRCHIILCCGTGKVLILDGAYTKIAEFTSAYLVGDAANFSTATVSDEFFICNSKIKPTVTVNPTPTKTPDQRGFFYVKAGAYSKEYSLDIKTSKGVITASYMTPTGANAGDAAGATPEAIANSLVSQLNTKLATAGITALKQNKSYVYLESSESKLVVHSASGSGYIMTSNDSYVAQAADLPSLLDDTANGYILRTGSVTRPTYYQYNAERTAWLESGDFTSPFGMTGLPVSITRTAGVWKLVETAYEGRLSGDDDSNERPPFLGESGITGMGAFQGRLAILSGSMVSLSASNKPRRYFRSTVTSVVPNDCIHVGASANSSAAYRYAVPFQKDLLLFSEKYQALIPAGNQAITPSTATVVLTSTYDADTHSAPVTLGRTLMYPAPRSEDFFGILEMLPSNYVDSQYISHDATEHLPKYMGGYCRFGVSSSVANMVMFAPSRDTRALIVHEYSWSGDEKVQQAWHTWRFQHDIAAAYFSDQVINILFVQNGVLVGATIDPRVGVLTFEAARRPFLDLYSTVSIQDHVVTVPEWLVKFDPAAADRVKLSANLGDRAGEEVGFTKTNQSTLHTVLSQKSGQVSIGFPYRSTFSPTPPLMVDRNGVKIDTNKLTIQRFVISTANSSQYKAVVQDSRYSGDSSVTDIGTLYYSSAELDLGRARYANQSVGVLPCRTEADSTTLVLYTEGTGEFNLTGLEYVAKFHQRIRRR